jgi:hypothetical protein
MTSISPMFCRVCFTAQRWLDLIALTDRSRSIIISFSVSCHISSPRRHAASESRRFMAGKVTEIASLSRKARSRENFDPFFSLFLFFKPSSFPLAPLPPPPPADPLVPAVERLIFFIHRGSEVPLCLLQAGFARRAISIDVGQLTATVAFPPPPAIFSPLYDAREQFWWCKLRAKRRASSPSEIKVITAETWRTSFD